MITKYEIWVLRLVFLVWLAKSVDHAVLLTVLFGLAGLLSLAEGIHKE